MRLEQLPLILATIVALLGIGLLGDAFVADRGGPPLAERRRRTRAERDRLGEGIVGLGTLCMAAALAGRDTWPYGNVAVIAGAILLVVGAALNHSFLRELLLFRGPARRQDERAPRGAEVVRHRGESEPTASTEGPSMERPTAEAPASELPAAVRPPAERSTTEQPAAARPAEERTPSDRTPAERTQSEPVPAERQTEERPAAEERAPGEHPAGTAGTATPTTSPRLRIR